MTNHILRPIPADADCTALMIDTLRAAAADLTSSIEYFADRFDMISDYDDYAPAAANIAASITYTFLSHIHNTPRDALNELLADDSFIDDMLCADFSSPLHDFIDYAD